jgi:hypothetical protein
MTSASVSENMALRFHQPMNTEKLACSKICGNLAVEPAQHRRRTIALFNTGAKQNFGNAGEQCCGMP